MKTVSAADANRHFSQLLRDVGAGETVTITSRGKPVATLAPVTDSVAHAEWLAAKKRLFDRLESQSARNLGSFHRDEAYEDGAP